MRTAIIDAELVTKGNHRFPNLACMKLSAAFKERGDTVVLKTDYNELEHFDLICISKVFTKTPVPAEVLSDPRVIYGGTGFYYDVAPALPAEIEHHFPDYHLYDSWVAEQRRQGKPKRQFMFYTDFSIGFLTRGCFRHCEFCVNKNCSRVETHSPLSEFLDPARPKIVLLDDNFLGHTEWKRMLAELKATEKPFQFKQGLDERLLTDEKCRELFSSKYAGDYIFAFDNIADAPLIEEKLKLIRRYTQRIPTFYCLCGFDRSGKWDAEFWRQDILDLFARIEILMRYRCVPYVMRYDRYTESPYRGAYITIARWCNQRSFFKKKTLREFAEANGQSSAAYMYVEELQKDLPQVRRYFNMRFPTENIR